MKATILATAVVLAGCTRVNQTVMVEAPEFPAACAAAQSGTPLVDRRAPSWTYAPTIQVSADASRHVPVSASAAQGDEAAGGMWDSVKAWLGRAAAVAAGAGLAK